MESEDHVSGKKNQLPGVLRVQFRDLVSQTNGRSGVATFFEAGGLFLLLMLKLKGAIVV